MLDTKLIFIEGLPGLGKTTTSVWLAKRLILRGFRVNFLEESQPQHPLNVGGDLHPACSTPGEVLFQRYTPDSYIQESLERWQAAVPVALQSEAINVLDSYPFQNSVRILLQMDAPIDVIREYFKQVESFTTPLHPVLIYYDQPDTTYAKDHFTQIAARRGSAWTEYATALVLRCPYAGNRHLQDFEGVLTFLADYKNLIDILLEQSRIPRIILDHGFDDWAEFYRQIEDFLGLPLTG